jgi:hypothetical protein
MFLLPMTTSVLGGAPSQDIHLAGLAPAVAAIMHRPRDEFVYVGLDPACRGTFNGVPVDRAALHHGDRLTLGTWTLIFQRDEFADHGRYDGGRQGGEFSGDRIDHL